MTIVNIRERSFSQHSCLASESENYTHGDQQEISVENKGESY